MRIVFSIIFAALSTSALAYELNCSKVVGFGSAELRISQLSQSKFQVLLATTHDTLADVLQFVNEGEDFPNYNFNKLEMTIDNVTQYGPVLESMAQPEALDFLLEQQGTVFTRVALRQFQTSGFTVSKLLHSPTSQEYLVGLLLADTEAEKESFLKLNLSFPAASCTFTL